MERFEGTLIVAGIELEATIYATMHELPMHSYRYINATQQLREYPEGTKIVFIGSYWQRDNSYDLIDIAKYMKLNIIIEDYE